MSNLTLYQVSDQYLADLEKLNDLELDDQTFKDTLMIRCLTDSDVDGKVYKTYEKAESACLDKLIEIVNDSK